MRVGLPALWLAGEHLDDRADTRVEATFVNLSYRFLCVFELQTRQLGAQAFEVHHHLYIRRSTGPKLQLFRPVGLQQKYTARP